METTIQAEEKLIRTLPEQSQTVVEQPAPLALLDNLIVILPFCFIGTWAIVCLISFFGVPKFIRKRPLSLKRAHQVPCRNCRFFSSNPYLKCALHPTSVLTDQAIGCSDFHERESLANVKH